MKGRDGHPTSSLRAFAGSGDAQSCGPCARALNTQRAPNEHSRAVGTRNRAAPAPAHIRMQSIHIYSYTMRRGACKKCGGKMVGSNAKAGDHTILGYSMRGHRTAYYTRPPYFLCAPRSHPQAVHSHIFIHNA